jgi:hypothetical protein
MNTVTKVKILRPILKYEKSKIIALKHIQKYFTEEGISELIKLQFIQILKN